MHLGWKLKTVIIFSWFTKPGQCLYYFKNRPINFLNFVFRQRTYWIFSLVENPFSRNLCTCLSNKFLTTWFEYSPWFSLLLTCLTSKLPLQKPKRFLWNLFSLLQNTSIFVVIWPSSCSSYQNGCPTIMPYITIKVSLQYFF